MKTLFRLLFVFLLLTVPCSAKSNWTINGIPLDEFKDLTWSKTAELGIGFGTSLAVHWLSHVAYLEMEDKDWHQDGLTEIMDGPMTDSEKAWMGRIGFLGQLSVGTLGKIFGAKKSYFWTGYHAGSLFEISTYPLFNRKEGEGDLNYIDENGNNNLEYAIYTTWSGILLVK